MLKTMRKTETAKLAEKGEKQGLCSSLQQQEHAF